MAINRSLLFRYTLRTLLPPTRSLGTRPNSKYCSFIIGFCLNTISSTCYGCLFIFSYCKNGPPFSVYYGPDPNSITFWPSNKLKTKSRRTADMSSAIASKPMQVKRQSTNVLPSDTRLVISSDANQSSTQLCANGESLGPDFFNVAEGQFCQMSTKTLYPVCSGVVNDNCFNAETQKLVIGGVSNRDVAYTKVIDWSSGSS